MAWWNSFWLSEICSKKFFFEVALVTSRFFGHFDLMQNHLTIILIYFWSRRLTPPTQFFENPVQKLQSGLLTYDSKNISGWSLDDSASNQTQTGKIVENGQKNLEVTILYFQFCFKSKLWFHKLLIVIRNNFMKLFDFIIRVVRLKIKKWHRRKS